MKNFIKASCTLVLSCALTMAYAGDTDDEKNVRYQFVADLSGAQAGVVTDGKAAITVKFSNDLSSVHYNLKATDTGTVTANHLHCAAAGAGGPSAATIQLGKGTLTNANINEISGNAACGVTINNVASLLNAMIQGKIYVNVHTDLYPAGELRGQIFSPLSD